MTTGATMVVAAALRLPHCGAEHAGELADADRRGLDLRPRQREREEELVPRQKHAQDACCRDARRGEGQHDPGDDLHA